MVNSADPLGLITNTLSGTIKSHEGDFDVPEFNSKEDSYWFNSAERLCTQSIEKVRTLMEVFAGQRSVIICVAGGVDNANSFFTASKSLFKSEDISYVLLDCNQFAVQNVLPVRLNLPLVCPTALDYVRSVLPVNLPERLDEMVMEGIKRYNSFWQPGTGYKYKIEGIEYTHTYTREEQVFLSASLSINQTLLSTQYNDTFLRKKLVELGLNDEEVVQSLKALPQLQINEDGTINNVRSDASSFLQTALLNKNHWLNPLNYSYYLEQLVNRKIGLANLPLQLLPFTDFWRNLRQTNTKVAGVYFSNAQQYMHRQDLEFFLNQILSLPMGSETAVQYFVADSVVSTSNVCKASDIGPVELDEMLTRNWSAKEAPVSLVQKFLNNSAEQEG